MISGPFFSSPSPLLSTRQTSGQKYMHRQNSKLKLCRQSRQASRKPPSNAVGTWDLSVLIQRGVNKATVGTAPALPSSRCCPGIRETKVCLHCSGLLTTNHLEPRELGRDLYERTLVSQSACTGARSRRRRLGLFQEQVMSMKYKAWQWLRVNPSLALLLPPLHRAGSPCILSHPL